MGVGGQFAAEAGDGVGELFVEGGLGRFGVAGADRVDEGAVAGGDVAADGIAAGSAEGGDAGLDREGRHGAGEAPAAGRVDEGAVEGEVGVADGAGVVAGARVLEGGERGVEGVGGGCASRVAVADDDAHGLAFDGGAGVVDVLHVAFVDDADAEAAAGRGGQQPLLHEALGGFAERAAADAELRRDLDLADGAADREGARVDGTPQLDGDEVDGGCPGHPEYRGARRSRLVDGLSLGHSAPSTRRLFSRAAGAPGNAWSPVRAGRGGRERVHGIHPRGCLIVDNRTCRRSDCGNVDGSS
nr:hypothetical protein [Agromyces archimandritae]